MNNIYDMLRDVHSNSGQKSWSKIDLLFDSCVELEFRQCAAHSKIIMSYQHIS